jgi:hypothetical protein
MNGHAPTRVGGAEGPLAGPGIWGQFLVGSSLDALLPIGYPLEHKPGGVVIPRPSFMTVPGIPPGEVAYIQFAAWDGNAWGTVLEDVPVDQLGRTDVAATGLGGVTVPFPSGAPYFEQPAIIPPVPEPSSWALLLLAGGALMWRVRKRPCL